MDPVTITLFVSTLVAGINAVAKLIQIANDPASSVEQRAAALAGANQIMAACEPLNAAWAALAPK